MSSTAAQTHGCSRRRRRAIERMFAKNRGTVRQRRVFEHVRTCHRCRPYYRKLLRAERALVGDSVGGCRQPTHLELERVGARVMVSINAARSANRRVLRVSWLTATPLLLAGLLALAIGVHPWAVSRDDFRRKGGDTLPAAARLGDTAASVSALRLVRENDDYALQRPLAAPNGVAQLELSDGLLLRYSNREPRLRYVFVVGVDPSFQPRWFFPAPPQRNSVAIAAGVVDRPLGDPTLLRVNHRAGRLTIFALFSEHAISAAQVSAALQRHRKRTDVPSSVRQLSIAGVARQQRLDFEIVTAFE